MPIYNYQFLDLEGNPLDEYIEIMHSIIDDALTIEPDSKRPIRRIISAVQVRDSRPAWERCSDVKKHIQQTKPKWVIDSTKGIKEKFDPKKHG
jgi:hypothetical protein